MDEIVKFLLKGMQLLDWQSSLGLLVQCDELQLLHTFIDFFL
jgi:hypothetical protein